MAIARRPSHGRLRNTAFRGALVLAWLVSWVVLPSRSGAQSAGIWSPIPYTGGYTDQGPTRYGQVSVYDAARRRLLVLAGLFGSAQHLHSLDVGGGTGWLGYNVSGAPSFPPVWAASGWDPLRDRLYLFGGLVGFAGSDSVASSEVRYVTAGGSPQWTVVAPQGAPPSPRWGSAMVYDVLRRRLLLYGGHAPASGSLGETWVFNMAATPTWVRVVTEGDDPGPREGASLVYDRLLDRVLLYGGSRDGDTLSDVYEMRLATLTPAWTRISAEGDPPPARAYHQAVLDSVGRDMIVCGGTALPVDSDVWRLSLDGPLRWSRVESTGGPVAPRHSFSAAFDNPSRRLVLHAGLDPTTGTRLQDTPALTLEMLPPRWLLGGGGAPTARYGSSAIYDSLNDRFIVLGGRTEGTSDEGSVWELRLDGYPRWTRLVSGVATLFGVGVVVDPVRRRLIAIGGAYGDLTFTNCVSAFQLDGPFVGGALMGSCVSGTPPPARAWHAVAYDSRRDGVWVFGGYNTSGPLNDVWFLSLSPSPSWTQVIPDGSGPSARRGVRAIYDRVGDRLILHGGSNPAEPVNGNVWYLNLSGPPSWVQVSAGCYPRDYHALVMDPRRNRLVTYGGGFGITYGLVESALLQSLDSWSLLDPIGATAPSGRTLHAYAYDSRRDRLFVFGGVDRDGRRLRDAWLLDWADLPTAVSVSAAGWSATPGSVHLEWRTTARAEAASVYRRGSGAEWYVLGPPVEAGPEALVYVDQSVTPGSEYEYGLALEGGRPQATIPVRVPLAVERPAISFERNPFEGSCRLRVTSAGGPARLELFDSIGRRWWSGELPSGDAGSRSFTAPLPDAAPPGLYVVRMRQGDASVSARAFRLR